MYRYVTESTFDSYLWQTVEAKQKFISQIMTSKTPLRSCEDVDEQALSYAEIKALCAGDPCIRQRMELDVDVARLRVMKADWQSKRFRLEDEALRRFPAEIAKAELTAGGIAADIAVLKDHPAPEDGFAGMRIDGRGYADKSEAGEALLDAVTVIAQTEPVALGSYRGFAMSACMTVFGEHRLMLKGAVTYSVELGDSAAGNLTRIDNALARLPEHLDASRSKLSDLRQQLEAAKAEAALPFRYEAELADKAARLAALDAELNLGGKGNQEPPAA